MAMPLSIPTVLGCLAVFATAALTAIHAILARSLDDSKSSTTRIIAIVACAVEGVSFFVLCIHLILHLRRAMNAPPSYKLSQQTSPARLWFGLTILLCTAAAGVSVAALVLLGRSASSLPPTIFGSGAVSFLAGASVTLGISYVAQLIFLLVHCIASRSVSSISTENIHTHSVEDGNTSSGADSRASSSRRMHASRVKSIPYSQTSSQTCSPENALHAPKYARTRGSSTSSTAVSHSPPSSSGGKSATETMCSIRSSLTHAVRPISSKTRLIRPTSQPGTTPSVPSSSPTNHHNPDSSTTTEDSFDSWDTSAVEPHNRQAVMESASPVPARFLETIPASPSTSRSPSPGMPLDLEPPRSRRRSRSYSPAASSTRSIGSAGSRMQSQSHSQSPTNEAHIHPLFRSDSPTPPSVVSAGTVVTAAPNGGLIMTDPSSIRTLNRMRSGSLPAVSSPLSRQGSFDDFGVRLGAPVVMPPTEDLREDETETDSDEITLGGRPPASNGGGERKMTPPIPEWILSAGSYESRKMRGDENGHRDDDKTPGLAL